MDSVVDPFGRADIETGDDEAEVEAEFGSFNTRDGAPFVVPGFCLVAGVRIAQNRLVPDGASRAITVLPLDHFEILSGMPELLALIDRCLIVDSLDACGKVVLPLTERSRRMRPLFSRVNIHSPPGSNQCGQARQVKHHGRRSLDQGAISCTPKHT
jgi:hypothetical protein